MAKIIIGLAGEMASGKGTVAKYIVEKYAGEAFRFSTMLRDVLTRLYLDHSRQNMQTLSTILRQHYGEDTLAKAMSEDVKASDKQTVVIEGIRRLADIKYLRELPAFKFVYIGASMENRYSRIIKRNENPDDADKTLEQFKKDHEAEPELQIRDLKNRADAVIDNNGSFEEFYLQIDKLIK